MNNLSIAYVLLLVVPLTAFGFPSEIKLTNGAVLHRCVPLRWAADYVVIKHAGGADPIRFANIAPDDRAAVIAERPLSGSKTPETAASIAKTIHVPGQCYITTQGAGAYKMADVRIMVFPASVAGAFETNLNAIDLPAPSQSVTTDADGKFALDLQRETGPWLIVAQGSRRVGSLNGGDPWERYEWHVRYDGEGELRLNGQNCSSRQHTLKISE